MSGFMSSTTALKIFEAPAKNPDADRLREHGFSPTPGPDGKRVGWVGLGNPLDLAFDFGIDHGRFLAFSLRIDERKPSGAAIKIRLAEAVRDEAAANGGKVSAKRKKELKERITDEVTARADYLPSLVDCIWDLDADRLYVSTASETVLNILLDLFHRTFGVVPVPVAPGVDMADFFARVFRESLSVNGMEIAAGSSVTLVTPEHQEDKAQVVVVNNQGAVATALAEGLRISKMALIATEDDQELTFSLADDLSIAGLKLPKGEKGDEADATFLLKADACARVAAVVEALSK